MDLYLYHFNFCFILLSVFTNERDQIVKLTNQNAYIPGIGPGADTASYISRMLFKVTMVGATYLSLLAALPIIVGNIFGLPA